MQSTTWALFVVLLPLASCTASSHDALTKGELGERLFNDPILSNEQTESCATCHEPHAAFVDTRPFEGSTAAASLGDDGQTLGDRNTPTAAYAAFIPPLTKGTRKRPNTAPELSLYEGYLGGIFLDGRARDLAEQAGGPILNPVEMAMPDRASVIERLSREAEYVDALRANYGDEIFEDVDAAYEAVTDSIAAFESTDFFSPFDSRYDRSILPSCAANRYEYDPSSRAAQGKELFFSAAATSCAACHQLHAADGPEANREIFTGFEYHNLGVPENTKLRKLNAAPTDLGLETTVQDEAERGKFRTPTLRNVSLTGPYMHNGLFSRLSTVIRFLEHRKRRARGDTDDSVNPETREPWAAPEVDQNLNETELAKGDADLSDENNVLALECFLMSLTDARYEKLLDAGLVQECGL